jgi:hypothetical protein
MPPRGDLLFVRQWLNERNLGLVPIADAARFAWPGPWIARVRGVDGEHAVVLFGSPPGPLLDPAGAVAAGGEIVEGWAVAALDLALGHERPYGDDAGVGAVAVLLVAGEAEAPLRRVDAVTAVAGRGLEGDRYGAGRGTFSGGGRGYELTLVESEALDDVGLACELARRNVVTRGVDLNALAGRRFRLGDAECVGRRLAEPCAHLERLSGPGLLRPLVHRAGLRADILVGGTIRVGDALQPLGDGPDE